MVNKAHSLKIDINKNKLIEQLFKNISPKH